MSVKKATSDKLAEALIHAKAPQIMIERARSGMYDDFKSDLPLPLHALVDDAKQYHLNNIALRAMNGEFDAEQWEADAWAISAEGQEAFQQILHEGHEKS